MTEEEIKEKGLNSHPLTYEEIVESAKDIIQKSKALLPGKTENDKKNWCIKKLTQVFEVFDNYVPIIGTFLDIPFVDDLEKQAVSLLVDWAWDNFVEEDEKEIEHQDKENK
jgi:hypothetical protein